MGGVWSKIESDRCIQTSGKNNPGDMVEAGLPEIEGNIGFPYRMLQGNDGCFTRSNNYNGTRIRSPGEINDGYPNTYIAYFNASKSNEIYGNSDTVQPPAYIVIGWKRES